MAPACESAFAQLGMPKFRYLAQKANGDVVSDTLQAASRDGAVATIRANQLLPLSVKPAGLAWLNFGPRGGRARPVMRPQDLLIFANDLAVLLRAGVSLDVALRLTGELSAGADLKKFATAVFQSVRKGAGLADAIESQTISVPAYYVGLIRAGENGGSLFEALDGLSRHLTQSTRLAREIRSAFYYPSFVIAVSLATIALMLLYVIPEFKPLFETGTAPPFELTVLFMLSDFLSRWGWLMLGAVALGLAVFRTYLASARSRSGWHRLTLRIPLIGRLVQRVEAARFCRTLGALHAGGLPMLGGLVIAAGVIQNQDIAGRVQQVIPHFRQGGSLASALEQAALFSPLGNRLMRIGEESGQMEAMLLRLADVYDEEVKLRLTRLEAMLVPAITIGMGLFVGGIVAVMLTAILSSYDLAS